jgi:hypothetical protein
MGRGLRQCFLAGLKPLNPVDITRTGLRPGRGGVVKTAGVRVD